ncbi:CU044_5270 family protein [Streptomyces sp. CA-210063]|uniref:CU044_5270 family protein n=1 Tax=Streptomyces sp. CA-210063 TaxID=2801029 RepID=UPI00214B3226|nr:CU044_5270 family protein [Streptomyces sp. CA-210063]UUU32334.1 CU044_5270 family protein [Streptomyces sp. CA-210063]
MSRKKTYGGAARRRDVMETLADARPAELDPSLLAGSRRQREDLARITAATRERPMGGPLAWLRPRLLPLGAVATVAASAIVAGTLVQQDSRGTTGAQPGNRPPSATATRLDGRMELLGAAKAAEASAAEGTYWQVTTRSENVDVVGEPGRRFAVRSTETQEWSVGVRPGTRSLMVTGLDAGTEPRTPADEARWRAAGSPRQVESPADTEGRMRVAITIGAPGRPTVMRTDSDNKIYALGPDNVSYQDVRKLPTDSARLRQQFERLYERDSGSEISGDRTAWMLRQAANVITMPVKPGTRAAAYRLLADLPGIRVQGSVTDPLGREGIGITLPDHAETPLGSVEQRLVVDPSTGALLAELVVLAEPSAAAREAGLDAGTTVSSSATTRMEWAQRQITVPENARH